MGIVYKFQSFGRLQPWSELTFRRRQTAFTGEETA